MVCSLNVTINSVPVPQGFSVPLKQTIYYQCVGYTVPQVFHPLFLGMTSIGSA